MKFDDWWEKEGLNFAHRDACRAAFALGALKTVEEITRDTDAFAKRALEAVGVGGTTLDTICRTETLALRPLKWGSALRRVHDQ